mmetsp:Transcript_22173/g.69163  ORF Transcript_22173/g.69163 Transcript_22173/m.69163 type:complete len:332 (-) Transcript_22173:1091-2086(-)
MTERTIPRSRLLGKAFVVVISCARTCDVNDSGASRHRGSLVARAAGAAGGGGGWRAKAPPRPASGVVKPPKTYRNSTSGLFLMIARPRQGSKNKPHGKSPPSVLPSFASGTRAALSRATSSMSINTTKAKHRFAAVARSATTTCHPISQHSRARQLIQCAPYWSAGRVAAPHRCRLRAGDSAQRLSRLLYGTASPEAPVRPETGVRVRNRRLARRLACGHRGCRGRCHGRVELVAKAIEGVEVEAHGGRFGVHALEGACLGGVQGGDEAPVDLPPRDLVLDRVRALTKLTRVSLALLLGEVALEAPQEGEHLGVGVTVACVRHLGSGERSA